MIAVAVSGGMDSLHALHTFHALGQPVFALHGLFLARPEAAADPQAGLAAFCRERDIPLHIIDLTAAFEEHIIAPFCRAYAAAETPNPCAACNTHIKFGALYDAARALGATRLATGHYARLLPYPDAPMLLLPATGEDVVKDQSYFLALTPVERLREALFPLGGITKIAVAEELRALNITPPIPSESQDICFVPGNDYRALLVSRNAGLSGPGPVRDTSGKLLGTHRGLWNHTEGQRKGLGIAAAQPLYVLEKDAATNTLIVGSREETFSTDITAVHANFMLDPALWPSRGLLARARYRQPPQPADVSVNGSTLRIRFKNPQPLSARGQVAAVYDERGFLLAGAVIGQAR